MNGEGEHTLAAVVMGWVGWVSLASVRTFTNKTRLEDIKETLLRLEKKIDDQAKEAKHGDHSS